MENSNNIQQHFFEDLTNNELTLDLNDDFESDIEDSISVNDTEISATDTELNVIPTNNPTASELFKNVKFIHTVQGSRSNPYTFTIEEYKKKMYRENHFYEVFDFGDSHSKIMNISPYWDLDRYTDDRLTKEIIDNFNMRHVKLIIKIINSNYGVNITKDDIAISTSNGHVKKLDENLGEMVDKYKLSSHMRLIGYYLTSNKDLKELFNPFTQENSKHQYFFDVSVYDSKKLFRGLGMTKEKDLENNSNPRILTPMTHNSDLHLHFPSFMLGNEILLELKVELPQQNSTLKSNPVMAKPNSHSTKTISPELITELKALSSKLLNQLGGHEHVQFYQFNISESRVDLDFGISTQFIVYIQYKSMLKPRKCPCLKDYHTKGSNNFDVVIYPTCGKINYHCYDPDCEKHWTLDYLPSDIHTKLKTELGLNIDCFIDDGQQTKLNSKKSKEQRQKLKSAQVADGDMIIQQLRDKFIDCTDGRVRPCFQEGVMTIMCETIIKYDFTPLGSKSLIQDYVCKYHKMVHDTKSAVFRIAYDNKFGKFVHNVVKMELSVFKEQIGKILRNFATDEANEFLSWLVSSDSKKYITYHTASWKPNAPLLSLENERVKLDEDGHPLPTEPDELAFNTYTPPKFFLYLEDSQPCDYSKIEFVMDHIKNVLCSGDEEVYWLLMKLLASFIQMVYNRKMQIIHIVVIFIDVVRGTGKNTVFEKLWCGLIGPQNCTTVSNLKAFLESRFNNEYCKKLFYYINDIKKQRFNEELWEGLRQRFGRDTIICEEKYFSPHEAENKSLTLMDTNNPEAVSIDPNDRNIFPIYITELPEYVNEAYLNRLLSDCKSEEVRCHFAKYLNEMDLTGYSPFNYKTAVKMCNNGLLMRNNNVPILMKFLQHLVMTNGLDEYKYKNKCAKGDFKLKQTTFNHNLNVYSNAELNRSSHMETESVTNQLTLYELANESAPRGIKHYNFPSYDRIKTILLKHKFWLETNNDDDE